MLNFASMLLFGVSVCLLCLFWFWGFCLFVFVRPPVQGGQTFFDSQPIWCGHTLFFGLPPFWGGQTFSAAVLLKCCFVVCYHVERLLHSPVLHQQYQFYCLFEVLPAISHYIVTTSQQQQQQQIVLDVILIFLSNAIFTVKYNMCFILQNQHLSTVILPSCAHVVSKLLQAKEYFLPHWFIYVSIYVAGLRELLAFFVTCNCLFP